MRGVPEINLKHMNEAHEKLYKGPILDAIAYPGSSPLGPWVSEWFIVSDVPLAALVALVIQVALVTLMALEAPVAPMAMMAMMALGKACALKNWTVVNFWERSLPLWP